ncbi:MAG TPA: hypothetical protein PLS81_12905 [Deltaproteobacteria bacterium]|nr:hypothetical protein [Deltaproteobacteria bacterium]
MVQKIFLAGLFLAVIFAVAAAFGAYRWEAKTRQIRLRLEEAREPASRRKVDFRELEGLPTPVQRYFRAVLKDGQPMVEGVHARHAGSFNMGEDSEKWRPFASDQRVVTARAGIDWDARVSMLPGLRVHVHDAYVAGEGILQSALLGLVPLVDVRGGGEVARGELMRFFAEAAWYPTALLPGPGVRWEAIDDRSARGVLTDGAVTLSLLFTFGEDGLIETVCAQDRPRMVDGRLVPTPWCGRFWNYQERSGMMVPVDGEVSWLLPGGARPYWRGRLTDIVYEFAR